MSAPPRGDFHAATEWLDSPVAELRRWTARTLLGLLWCAALLIVWRRFAGMVSVPLAPAWLLGVGILVALAAAAVRIAEMPPRLTGFPSSRHGIFNAASPLTTVAVLAMGIGLSLPGTNALGLIGFWALLLGGEVWAWRRSVTRRPGIRPDVEPDTRRPADNHAPDEHGEISQPGGDVAVHGAEVRGVAVSDDAVSGDFPSAGPSDDSVLQQSMRRQAADGSEEFLGWLRASLTAGQRTAVVHLAFCPPFTTTPEVTLEPTDGPKILRLNKTVFPYGARFDLKLAAATDNPTDVVLRFAARSRPTG